MLTLVAEDCHNIDTGLRNFLQRCTTSYTHSPSAAYSILLATFDSPSLYTNYSTGFQKYESTFRNITSISGISITAEPEQWNLLHFTLICNLRYISTNFGFVETNEIHAPMTAFYQ